MTLLPIPVLLAAGCILWNEGPYNNNVARLADADADGSSVADGDCNDADPEVNPRADEVCDAKDNDCNGLIDEIPPEAAWCEDLDGDSYGNINISMQSCFPESGWVRDCTDCADTAPAVNPGATESCNGVDDDCDGVTDPNGADGSVTWYPDRDGDGYGGTEPLTTSCAPPEGGVEDHSDCDDESEATHPGAAEICGDGQINDCTDESVECGWTGSDALSTSVAAFIAGPETRNEYLGLGVGFMDANGDGVDEIVMSSSGSMYGDDSAGTVHVWYGAPVGDREIDETTTRVVGQPDLYLGASLRGAPAIRLTDPDSGENLILFATQGYSSEFDSRGVVMSTNGSLYGQLNLSPGDIFARGASDMESFGSTISVSTAIGDEPLTLVIGAPYNSDRSEFAGAVYLTTPSEPNAADASAVILGAEHEFLGGSVLCDEDLDGDGMDDLVLGTGYDAEPRLYMFRGPISGTSSTDEADTYVADTGMAPDTTITIPDLDGDGLTDLATERDHGLVLHRGVTLGTQSHSPAVIGALTEDPPKASDIDFALATGDAQSDGVADLFVGIPYLKPPPEFGGLPEAGAVAIIPLSRPYTGNESLRDVASAVFYGPDARASAGVAISVGDVNSDAYIDLLIGAPGWSSNGYPSAGGVWFILGGGI